MVSPWASGEVGVRWCQWPWYSKVHDGTCNDARAPSVAEMSKIRQFSCVTSWLPAECGRCFGPSRWCPNRRLLEIATTAPLSKHHQMRRTPNMRSQVRRVRDDGRRDVSNNFTGDGSRVMWFFSYLLCEESRVKVQKLLAYSMRRAEKVYSI